MKIYTKTGDLGETSLFGGERRMKSNLRIESYGTVDELQAALGIALAELSDYKSTWVKPVQDILEGIQADTFILCSELARPDGVKVAGHSPVVSDKIVEHLEATIDLYESKLIPLRNFIMQGGSKPGAALHLSRAVCRRAERVMVSLNQEETLRPEVLKYVNRLSDLLFVLARYINHEIGTPETIWK